MTDSAPGSVEFARITPKRVSLSAAEQAELSDREAAGELREDAIRAILEGREQAANNGQGAATALASDPSPSAGADGDLSPDVVRVALGMLPPDARAAALAAMKATFAADPSTPPFTLHTAAEALQPRPPRQYILDGIIGRRDLSGWYGEPGCKKTYSLFDLAVCVAKDEPWLGMKVTPCPVLIVDEESGEDRIARRIGAALRGHYPAGMIPPDFPLSYLTLERFNLRDKADVDRLRLAVEMTGAGLVIIDALVDVLAGGDENATQDMQPFCQNLRGIANALDCHIALIHHANKLGGYRGSSAILGAVDVFIKVESKSGSGQVTFTPEKLRDGEPKQWAAKAHWETDSFWLSPADPAPAAEILNKAQSYVMRYLRDHDDRAALTDIQSSADTCSPEAARRAVYDLAARGLIARMDAGGPGAKAIYGVIAAPESDEDSDEDDG